jgi:adenylate cyclase
LIIGVIVGGLMSIAVDQNYLRDIRTRLEDNLYLPRPTRGIVSIIAIDDASLAAYGRSAVEWDRRVYVDLIRVLDAAGARVIAFDVMFVDPSDADAQLAETMRQARNVIQPVFGLDNNGACVPKTVGLLRCDYYVHPVPALEAAAMGLGHVTVRPDLDGFARRVPLFTLDGDKPVPSLALAAYLEYLRLLPEMVEIDQNEVRFAGRELPTDNFGQLIVYFFGPPSHPNQQGTFPVYSLVDVVEGRISPNVFNDQIVLIGALDAAAQPDSYPTPVTREVQKMYGVEIHANLIETIHQSLPRFQQKIDWKLNLGLFKLPLYRGTTDFPLREQSRDEQLVITFALAVIAGLLLPFLRWYVGLILVIVAYAAYFMWASFSFTLQGKIVDFLFPAGSLAFTFVGTMIISYIFEERRRTQINDLFSRYVSPEIAQKIVEAFDHGKLELGGEEREITVLFADVRGFTQLSEGLPASEIVQVLNVFLEEMSGIVMRRGGAINKYIGDNVMAFWNAPYPQADHAWLGTEAALEMLAAVERLNHVRKLAIPMQFGIGVNTGMVVVGNIGSQKRLEYTPIGDTVNVASRLCGVAPGGSCYIGARTYALIADRVQPVAVHNLQLKGKQDAVEIFELNAESLRAKGKEEG